jgi:G3E family GTPase
VGSISLETAEPLDPQRFQAWMTAVLAQQGTRLYRLKGFVSLKGVDERIVIQGVHMVLDTSSLGPWGERPRRTQLVFIGRELDEGALEAGFNACFA